MRIPKKSENKWKTALQNNSLTVKIVFCSLYDYSIDLSIIYIYLIKLFLLKH